MSRCRLVAFVALLATARLSAADPVAVLLVAADDELLQPVLAKVSDPASVTRGAWTCWTGQLGGKRVALTRAEGDPLNAVAATTLAIRLHTPRLIVVLASGHALDPALRAGDVVISSAFAAFDGQISPITALGGGSQPLAWSKLPHLLIAAGEKEVATESFPADAPAASLALAIKPARGRVISGVIGSANQLNLEADRIQWLRTNWKLSIEDRVSAHVAGCAQLLAVPAVGICTAGGSAHETAEFALKLVEALK